MNFRYKKALMEIKYLVTMGLLKDNDLLAMDTFKEISEKINAALDGVGVAANPIVPAKVIPHDEPAAEVSRTEEEKQKQRACSCFSLGNGAFPIRRANTESGTMEHVWIDGRRFTMEVVVAEKVDGITKECEFTICDNGQIKLEAHYYGGKSNAAKIAHKALKTYVKQLTGASKFHSRGGFLKQALKRLTEQRGKDSAAPVEEEAVNG